MRKCFWLVLIVVQVSCKPGLGIKSTAPHIAHNNLVVSGKFWASAFHQKAAEYTALCHQAYNIAKIKLDGALGANTTGKPLAIITDIDETVLNNSPYTVHRSLNDSTYDKSSWYNWTAKEAATPIPGSVEFFNYAASKGVQVFYITNRDEVERTATLRNLKKFNYPFTDDTHLIVRQTTSSKESRRKPIAEQYEIVLLLGDNLADFSSLWDKKSIVEREKNVNDNAAMFGNKFIMLPNTDYGGWEDAMYGNQYNLTPAQKDSAVKAGLKWY
ncbi:MAG: 5'-nucleotidase, lipoprotein e(P4) family [Niabella sp.]